LYPNRALDHLTLPSVPAPNIKQKLLKTCSEVLEETRKAHKQRQTAIENVFVLQMAGLKEALGRIIGKQQKEGDG